MTRYVYPHSLCLLHSFHVCYHGKLDLISDGLLVGDWGLCAACAQSVIEWRQVGASAVSCHRYGCNVVCCQISSHACVCCFYGQLHWLYARWFTWDLVVSMMPCWRMSSLWQAVFLDWQVQQQPSSTRSFHWEAAKRDAVHLAALLPQVWWRRRRLKPWPRSRTLCLVTLLTPTRTECCQPRVLRKCLLHPPTRSNTSVTLTTACAQQGRVVGQAEPVATQVNQVPGRQRPRWRVPFGRYLC